MNRAIRIGERVFLWVVAAAAVAAYVVIYSQHLNDPPIRSDGYSYYVYLPASLIYDDPSLQILAEQCCNGTFPSSSGITRWGGTGAWINPHPIGTAILMAPFFVLGHLLTRWSNLPPTGFSLYYQHAAGLAGVFYLVAGLAVLRAFLRRHFTPGVVLAALVSVTWGTNLFHYGTYDSVFSHVYSFFLCCCVLEATAAWHAAPRAGRSLLVGTLAGLVFLTRHANLLFPVLVFLLYGIVDRASLAGRLRLYRAHAGQLAIIGAAAAVIVVPQFALYRAATGRMLIDPYGNLLGTAGIRPLHFDDPQLWGVLFGVRKGIFFWSPVLLLSVAGIAVLRGSARVLQLPSLVYFPTLVYLIASWWDWQFGGSYSHRGFTDSLGASALGLAAAYQWAATRPLARRALTIFVTLAVLLSVAQMMQYWLGIVPFMDSTWDGYRSHFLRFTQ